MIVTRSILPIYIIKIDYIYCNRLGDIIKLIYLMLLKPSWHFSKYFWLFGSAILSSDCHHSLNNVWLLATNVSSHTKLDKTQVYTVRNLGHCQKPFGTISSTFGTVGRNRGDKGHLVKCQLMEKVLPQFNLCYHEVSFIKWWDILVPNSIIDFGL